MSRVEDVRLHMWRPEAPAWPKQALLFTGYPQTHILYNWAQIGLERVLNGIDCLALPEELTGLS